MESCERVTAEVVLCAFDEYLRRVRGVCAGTRRNYVMQARAFLNARFGDGPVSAVEIEAGDVREYVRGLTSRYQTKTVEGAASALRVFFRYLCSAGLRADRLDEAVPMVPSRTGGLARHLPPERLAQLLASLDSSTTRGLRDRGIILCMARLGLRAGEVVQLELDDLDWANAVVNVRARKTGRGARVPLTAEVGTAIAEYLQQARPATADRHVFVLHRLRTGAPISASIVGRAVVNALQHAGMDAPVRGANLLRHSLATDLQAHGVGLRQIADVLGHTSLATTRIYAAVDVAALREVALPWPVTS